MWASDLLFLSEMSSTLRSSVQQNALSQQAGKRKKPSTTTPRSHGGLEMLQISAQQLHEPLGSMAHPLQSNLPIQRHWLKIQPSPPRYPFVDVFFSMQVFLVDKKENMKGGLQLPLHLELLYENGQPAPDQKILELQGDHPMMESSGMTALQIRIKQCSMQHDNRAFRVRVSCPIDPSAYGAVGAVEPVVSPPMSVIRHRLKIVEQPPSVWFKDEGGRDKCMTMTVALVDENENPVSGREVLIRTALCYDGDVEVKSQNILKVINENTPRIGRDGKCVLKCRIDEVSKNHQKQPFCIKVLPDTAHSPSNFDISTDTSRPVTVRSKRNKKRKGDGPSSSSSSSRPEREVSKVEIKQEVPYMPAPPSIPSLPRTETKAVEYDMNELKALTGDFGTAVHGIISWSQFVLREMVTIEWQHVGYEVNERENTVNYHKPLYRCPGCWTYRDMVRNSTHPPNCPIFRIMSTYDTSVSKMLQNLVRYANSRNNKNPQKLDRMQSILIPGSSSDGLAPPPPHDPLVDFLYHADESSAGASHSTMPLTRAESVMDPSVTMQLAANGVAPPGEDSLFNFTTSAHDNALMSSFMEYTEISNNLEESAVEIILLVPTSSGFPAFNRNRDLIGFYSLDEANNMLVYVSADPKSQTKDYSVMLADSERTRPVLVQTKAEAVTLDQLKENALLQHYQNQAQGFSYPT